MNSRDTLYDRVLEDLRAHRCRLDDAIRALEAVVAARRPAAARLPWAAVEQASANDPRPGAFQGLTVIDATKRHLEHTQQSQRTTQILQALQFGGLALKGKSPINTVGAVLNTQLKKRAEIVRVGRGQWALASWPMAQECEPLGELAARAAGSAAWTPVHANGAADVAAVGD